MMLIGLRCNNYDTAGRVVVDLEKEFEKRLTVLAKLLGGERE